MEYRRLGKSSLVVSAMGLGCMGMSQSYGTPDDAESVATIHHAIDRGITLLDTADMYGGGTNEELVGRRHCEAAQRSDSGHEIRERAACRTGRFLGVNGQPEYVQQRLRGQPAAAEHSDDRSLLPASRGPERAD